MPVTDGDGVPMVGPVLVLAAVRADLAALGELRGGARRSLAALAERLAAAIDAQGDGAGPTTTARLAQELRTTLESLAREPGQDHASAVAGLLRALSTPEG